jgi:hypothetical protein
MYHTDIILTTAFMEQVYTIGWYQLLLGCIGTKWENAVLAYFKKENKSIKFNVWSIQAILLFWKYTTTQWGARNEHFHGKDAKVQADILLNNLRVTATHHYADYHDTPAMVLPQHAYLFTSRTLEQRLHLNDDNLSCWLRSVDDAKLTLAHHDTQLHN